MSASRPLRRSVWILALTGLVACGDVAPGKIQLAGVGDARVAGVRTAASVLQVAAHKKRTIAILHFENGTDDSGLDWLRRGLTDMLVTELGQSPFLDVFNPKRLDELLANAGKTADDVKDDPVAAKIARSANVETLLTGRFYLNDEQLVINAQLIDVETGRLVRREAVSGPGLERILSMASDLSRQVRDSLRGDDQVPRGGDLRVSEMTDSTEAFRHYSNALDLMDRLLRGEAADAFDAAVEADPEFAAAYLRKAGSETETKGMATALRSLAAARRYAHKLSRSDEVLLRLREAQFDGDAEEIRRVRDELWELAPYDVDVRMEVAISLFALRDYERALEEYELILEQDPYRKLAYNQLGYLYAYRGDFKTALSYLKRYRDLTPDEPNAYDSMGEVLVMAGRLEESIGHFKGALERWPDFFNSAKRLTEVYAELGELETALEYSERWYQTAPGKRSQARVLLDRGAMLWRYGRTDEAQVEFQRVREMAPDIMQAGWLEAEMLRSLGQEEAASALHAKCFDEHRSLVTEGDWEGDRVAGFLNLCLEGDRPVADLLAVVAIAKGKEKTTGLRDLFALYETVLRLRAGDFNGARSLADATSDNLDGLIQARHVQRNSVWKYLIEAIELEPKTDPPTKTIADKVFKAAHMSGRSDLETMARLLQVQYDAKYGRESDVAGVYRDLGIPREGVWQVVGPFENRAGFPHVFPPEKLIDLNATYTTSFNNAADGSTELRWQSGDDGVTDGFVDFKEIFGRSNWGVAYAVVTIDSPDERVVQLRVGADDSVKLWLNDHLVWQSYRRYEAPLDNDIVKVMLRPGENRLRIKVTNTLSGFGFYLRVTDEDGVGDPAISFRPMTSAK